MNNKLILIPDLHLQNKKSHYLADVEFLNWLSNQEFNNSNNYLLQLGDFFEKYNPEPSVVDLAIDFFHNKSKFKKNYILAGNTAHEFNRKNNSYAISSFSSLQNVECIYDIKELNLYDFKMLLLPWFYDNKYTDDKGNYLKFKDKISKEYIGSEILNTKYDLVSGHINTVDARSSDYNDLSFLNTDKIICGHIHTRSKTSLGICIPNNVEQDKFTSQIAVIDLITKETEYIDIPKFLVYDKVSYPNDITCIKQIDVNGVAYNQSVIYDIIDVVDKKTVLNYYTEKLNDNFFYRELVNKVDKTELLNSSISTSNKLTISDWKNKFINDNKIDKEVESKLKEYLK